MTSDMEDKPFWVSDETVNNCQKCSTEFTYQVLKHHCRKCAKIFCHTCSRQKALIPRNQTVLRPMNPYLSWVISEEEILTTPQRVCEACYEDLVPLQDSLQKEMSRCFQEGVQEGSVVSLPSANFCLEHEIERAMALLTLFKTNDVDVFQDCHGLLFLTVFKAGMIFSGKYGTGFVIAKVFDETSKSSNTGDKQGSSWDESSSTRSFAGVHWSAPSAVTLSGLGLGYQMGAEVRHVVFVLPSAAAVQAFKSKGQFSLGGEASVALGIGIAAEADVSAGTKGVGYGHGLSFCQGMFVGGSIEATVIAARDDVNRHFYGSKVKAGDLLSGAIARPPAVDPLYRQLEAITRVP